MLPINLVKLIQQSAHRPISSSKPDVPYYHDFVEKKGGPTEPPPRGKLATEFPDPRNPHLFLVPPRDNPQPDLELDSERLAPKELTLQDWKGYKTAADLFPNEIFEEGSIETSEVPTTETPSVVSGTGSDVVYLGLRGGTSGEYLSTTGGNGPGNELVGELPTLSTEGEATTVVVPKGQVPNQFASISLARTGPSSLIAGVTLGIMGQMGSILLSSFLIGLGVAAGSAFFRIAAVWIQKGLSEREEPCAPTLPVNLIPTGTDAPNITNTDFVPRLRREQDGRLTVFTNYEGFPPAST